MKNKSLRLIVTVIISQILVMSAVYMFVVLSVSSNIKNSTISSMENISQERSIIIQNYIQTLEQSLTSFSRSSDVMNLLKNPADPVATAQAQAYTETFSKDIPYVDGIYISEWDSHVLTHTNIDVVGIYTRKDDSLKTLQQAMIAADGVFNTGIIISPASGKQVVSLYRAIFDEEGQPIGFVGGAVYTDGLIETLNNLPAEGMNELKYYMVSLQDGHYIFHDDAEKINTVAEESYVKDIISDIKADNKKTYGNVEYTDSKTNESYIAAYSVIGKGWAFIITDPSSEVFSSLKDIQLLLVFVCLIGIIILTVLSYRIIKTLINSLNEPVRTLSVCSNSINDMTGELYHHSDKLVDSVAENTATIEELSASLESTDSIVESVQDKVVDIDQWMQNLLDDMKHSVDSSSALIDSSCEMNENAQSAVEGTKNTFETTKDVVKNTLSRLEEISKINKMADVILDVAKQTNLLAFNATLEAARAGEAGKGFSVVANEIGDLARSTSSMATDISEICGNINSSVDDVKQCFDTIIHFLEDTVITQFESFADKSHDYSQAVSEIQNNIMSLNQSAAVLRTSLDTITENIRSVKSITHENGIAIGMIATKNMSTSHVADNIKTQSDHNKELSAQLEDIIVKLEEYTSKNNEY